MRRAKNTYKPKGKKNYQIWIDEHKEDILKQESKNRVDYVYQNMNKELNLNMPLKSIYQLLYRNNLIEHKKMTQEKKKNDIEIINPKSLIDSLIDNNTNENINEYEKFDVSEFNDNNVSMKLLTIGLCSSSTFSIFGNKQHIIKDD